VRREVPCPLQTNSNTDLADFSKPVAGARGFTLPAFVAVPPANYATIPNYLAVELRYMDAGETRLKAQS
jgi:hypothetical protein